MRRLVVTSVLGSALLLPVVGLQAPASAQSVRMVGPAVTADCPSPHYATIAAAVAASGDDDIIVVCPGTYAETIDDQGKDLLFLGQKAGVDGRTRPVAATDETSIQTVGPVVHLTGRSGVDGFQLVRLPGGTGAAVTLAGESPSFDENVLTGASTGVDVTGTGALIDHNQLVIADGSTDAPPRSGGAGVVLDQGHGTNSSLQDNAFSGDLSRGAVVIGETAGSAPAEAIGILGNSADLGETGTFLAAGNTSGISVHDNTVNASTDQSSPAGIDLRGGNSDFTLDRNRITGGLRGISFEGVNGAGTIEQSVIRNTGFGVDIGGETGTLEIHSNIFVGNTTEAVASSNTNPGTVNAQNNFYGCNAGPTGINGCDGTPPGITTRTPYLVLTSTIATHSAQLDQAVTFTATLQRNSDGQTVALPVLDGEPIAFAYDHGSVTPPGTTLTGGSASTTARPTSSGSGTVTATVDNATSSQALNSAPVRPQIRIGDAGTAEGNSGAHALVFRVTLNHRSSGPVTVRYRTANSSATAPSDYVAKSGTVTFPAGATSRSISVGVRGDRTREPNETFAVTIFSPTNATVADAVGVGVIRNDD